MIYVCGDSFASSDPRSDITPWHELLDCTSLGEVGASNVMISKQVDIAIEQRAEFVIVLFTSSCRYEHESGPYTIQNPIESGLNSVQRDIIKSWTAEFFDLDREIYKNKCIIEGVLSRLDQSGIPFLFDQGGFEHPKWGVTQRYFTYYDSHRSKYNLWDYGDSLKFVPCFHIDDQNIHNQVAEYYHEQTR